MFDRSAVLDLKSLVEGQAIDRPDSPAVLAPGRAPLSHAGLKRAVRENADRLRGAGVGPQDRIALVLPNGPEMAVALLAAMTAAAAAPLNPAYSRDEFDFYLGDLEAGAVILPFGAAGPALDAARARRIPVIELAFALEADAGSLRLSSPRGCAPGGEGRPGADDIALLLHTSGTTSRPKLVPLTQANLVLSARNIGTSLDLSPDDRCLNMMPLFHIHGLAAALLASLAAGGSLICAAGFSADGFFDWLRDLRPTWYSAVPTIHQAVLMRAREIPVPRPAHVLRFVRSCSASLAPAVMSDLEALFGVPVVEAYGMTEASHQMACNPLPPRPRKPGSVGLPAGVEVAVLDEAGNPVPPGVAGEVAVRGRTITSGYLGNPEANAAAFIGGRLRTGDLGRFDADGYLFLSGRSKEMINRGGEKISPREVDDVLAAHPAVAQVAAFGMPDERLGEEVAAAVVLKPGAKIEIDDLRAWAASKTAYFKVPKRIVFVAEIPTGPTGKLQRIGLALKLGVTGSAGEAADPAASVAAAGRAADRPLNLTEGRLLGLMSKALGGKRIGVNDGFFDAGGDSLQAAALLAEIEAEFRVAIPIGSFLTNASAGRLAAVIENGNTPVPGSVILIKPGGTRPPFFCVHPHDGRAALFAAWAPHIAPDRPFYAFQDTAGDALRPAPGGIERMAGRYVAAMKAVRPAGPYLIGGYCFGAWLAFEMARILGAGGETPVLLALMDGYAPGFPRPAYRRAASSGMFSFLDRARRVRSLLAYLSSLAPGRKKEYLLKLARTLTRGTDPDFRGLPGREHDPDWRYDPPPFPGPAILFRPTREPLGFERDPAMGWSGFIDGRLEVENVPGYHRSLIYKPGYRFLAERLNARLNLAG